MKIHIPEFIPMAKCNEHLAHGPIDIDLGENIVHVVRCKDCEHFAEAKGKDSGKPCGYGQCKYPTGIRGIVFADDFCSFGKRRDDDGAD